MKEGNRNHSRYFQAERNFIQRIRTYQGHWKSPKDEVEAVNSGNAASWLRLLPPSQLPQTLEAGDVTTVGPGAQPAAGPASAWSCVSDHTSAETWSPPGFTLHTWQTCASHGQCRSGATRWSAALEAEEMEVEKWKNGMGIETWKRSGNRASV